MKQIRQNTFETNSSSTHSLVICTEEEYNKLNCNELFITWDGKILALDEAKARLLHCNINANEVEELFNLRYTDSKLFSEKLQAYDILTLDTFGEDYEWFQETYTSPSGDKIVAFGYYGEDR